MSTHKITRRIDDTHEIKLSAAEVLAMLQREGHVPVSVKHLHDLIACELDVDDGMTIEYGQQKRTEEIVS